MQNYFKNLSETTKGYLLIIVGVILLLNSLGLFNVILTNLILIAGIGMIVIGAMKTDLFEKIKRYVGRRK